MPLGVDFKTSSTGICNLFKHSRSFKPILGYNCSPFNCCSSIRLICVFSLFSSQARDFRCLFVLSCLSRYIMFWLLLVLSQSCLVLVLFLPWSFLVVMCHCLLRVLRVLFFLLLFFSGSSSCVGLFVYSSCSHCCSVCLILFLFLSFLLTYSCRVSSCLV